MTANFESFILLVKHVIPTGGLLIKSQLTRQTLFWIKIASLFLDEHYASWNFNLMNKNLSFFGFGLKGKNWIDNPILTLDCQSQSNPLNWIAIRVEQSSNPIQQYPGLIFQFFEFWILIHFLNFNTTDIYILFVRRTNSGVLRLFRWFRWQICSPDNSEWHPSF